jgi:hypothetical protein
MVTPGPGSAGGLRLDLSAVNASSSPPESPTGTPLTGVLTPTSGYVGTPGETPGTAAGVRDSSQLPLGGGVADEQQYVAQLSSSVWGDMMREAAQHD